MPFPPLLPSRLQRLLIAQMRNLSRPALRFASALLIFSPAYCAIFRPRLNVADEKQPLPSIDDFLIVKPGASFSFIFEIVTQTVSLRPRGHQSLRRKLTVCVTQKLAASVLAETWRPIELFGEGDYLSLKLREIKSVWLRMRARLSRRPVKRKAKMVRLSPRK